MIFFLATSEKRRSKVNPDQHLEQSWSSLSFFNQTQRGRLSAKNTPLNSQASNFPLFECNEEDTDSMERTNLLMQRLQVN